MPERFEIYIVYKRRYINTIPFLSFLAVWLPVVILVNNATYNRTVRAEQQWTVSEKT